MNAMTKLASAPVLALEISPLGERAHTGVANVTKALAKEMLADNTIDARFFMLRVEVPRRVVEQILSLEGGEILWWLSGRLDGHPMFQPEVHAPHIGIFTSTKRHRRIFPTEVLIVHDLTTITSPHFHAPEAVRFWDQHLLGDIMTSDLIVAVSEATKTDIRTYFPQAAHIPCVVSHLAACVGAGTPLPGHPTDYVVVLGTLEPRKNVAAILDCLANNPEIMEKVQFVFVGRWGWGDTAQKMVVDFGLSDYVNSSKIVFTGFVSDAVRNTLVANARLLVYPSRAEGFGLPVLEALQFGTPTLTSYSTSLPEVGGNLAQYCDFDSPVEVLDSLKTMLSRHRSRDDQARMQWAAEFTWTKTYRRIKDAALAQAALA
jgi:glycosyltransferase involved in cell wall biosynthesis